MHVILTPVGSSGDVNPFVIIGRELRRRGHDVTLIATAPFASVAANAELRFVPTSTLAEYEEVTSNPELWHPTRGVAVVLGIVGEYLRRGFAAIEQLYEPGRTLLVGHTLAFFTRVFEEVQQAPVATIHLAPNVFRSEFRQPAMPNGRDISAWPRWTKRALWWAVDRFAIDPHIAPALNAWRAELGLAPVSRIFNSWLHSPQCTLGLFPAWFGDPQPDWPRSLRMTGFVLSDEHCAADVGVRREAPANDGDGALEQFLAEGPAPIVFTPGSANRHAAVFFRAAIDATASIGRRALLITSYSEHLPTHLPAHVHHAGYAPFSTLFPRAAAVVHHGGIGTCAQAFAAGVPQLVMPMGFDQPDNAARVVALGAGDILRPSAFTPTRVAERLGRLLSSTRIADACRHWRDRIDAAAAVQAACNQLEQVYEESGSRLTSRAG